MSSISYLEMGEGSPIILLHGFCETKEIWATLAKSLSSKFKVIVPDLPGFGFSPALVDPFSIDDVAGAVVEWMRPWSGLRPVVIGHSLGGYVTLSITRHHPEIPGGIGLFHSTAFADTEEKKENRNKTISFVRKYGVSAYTTTFVSGLFYQKGNPFLPEILKMAAATPQKTLTSYSAAMRDRHSSTDVLQFFTSPVLFLAGAQDGIIPEAQLLEQAKMTGHAVFHSLAETGHMGMLESPAEAKTIIESFVHLCQNSSPS